MKDCEYRVWISKCQSPKIQQTAHEKKNGNNKENKTYRENTLDKNIHIFQAIIVDTIILSNLKETIVLRLYKKRRWMILIWWIFFFRISIINNLINANFSAQTAVWALISATWLIEGIKIELRRTTILMYIWLDFLIAHKKQMFFLSNFINITNQNCLRRSNTYAHGNIHTPWIHTVNHFK